MRNILHLDMDAFYASVETLDNPGPADRVASRMRSQGVKGRTVTLKVKYRDFTLITRAETLDRPTDDGGEVYRSVVRLLEKTEAGRRPLRLLGISLSQLEGCGSLPAPGKASQLPLFGNLLSCKGVDAAAGSMLPPVSPEKKEKLNRAVDRIREKFGEKGVAPGPLGIKGK